MLQQFASDLTYSYSSSTSSSSEGAAVLVLYLIILLIAIPTVIIPMWMLFKRAGKPGWASIIPVYSTWVMFEITGFTPWWALLSLIPFVSIFPAVVSLIAIVRLVKLFGKGTGFGVATIFFPFICLPILAYGKAPFQGAAAAPAAPAPQASAPTVDAPQDPNGAAPEGPVATAEPEQPADNNNQPPQAPVA
jgi:hypothetical protein